MAAVAAAALVGCAAYSGSGLVPGTARMDDVVAVMGPPAMQWTAADGSVQLAYPRGPLGRQTFMVFIGGDGRLARVEPVLDERHFAAVAPGHDDRETILRRFGPPGEVREFDRRNEENWEWRYIDAWSYPAQFVVVFDRATWKVKYSMQIREFSHDDRNM